MFPFLPEWPKLNLNQVSISPLATHVLSSGSLISWSSLTQVTPRHQIAALGPVLVQRPPSGFLCLPVEPNSWRAGSASTSCRAVSSVGSCHLCGAWVEGEPLGLRFHKPLSGLAAYLGFCQEEGHMASLPRLTPVFPVSSPGNAFLKH